VFEGAGFFVFVFCFFLLLGRSGGWGRVCSIGDLTGYGCIFVLVFVLVYFCGVGDPSLFSEV
jgi:hypothetical protein